LVPGFDEPILLPNGRKLRTLREAIDWLAKEIPKSEHTMEKLQTAAHCVTQAAERGGPMIFAQMGRWAIERYRTAAARSHVGNQSFQGLCVHCHFGGMAA